MCVETADGSTACVVTPFVCHLHCLHNTYIHVPSPKVQAPCNPQALAAQPTVGFIDGLPQLQASKFRRVSRPAQLLPAYTTTIFTALLLYTQPLLCRFASTCMSEPCLPSYHEAKHPRQLKLPAAVVSHSREQSGRMHLCALGRLRATKKVPEIHDFFHRLCDSNPVPIYRLHGACPRVAEICSVLSFHIGMSFCWLQEAISTCLKRS